MKHLTEVNKNNVQRVFISLSVKNKFLFNYLENLPKTYKVLTLLIAFKKIREGRIVNLEVNDEKRNAVLSGSLKRYRGVFLSLLTL